jgi:signal transduction histidine kinase
MRAGAHDYVMKRNLARLPLALSRELTEAEDRRERRRVEEALRRTERADRFLSRASALLSASLDLDETLARIASVAAPELADFCAVGMLESTPWVAAAIQADALGVARDAPPELFSSMTWTPEEHRALEKLRPAAYVCVPMHVGVETLGVLCLVSAKTRSGLGPTDIDLAQRFADRAAMAILHARLYREARDAVRARDDFLSIASHELRTPLTPLKLHMLRLRALAHEKKLGAMSDDELAKVMETSVRLVERLSLEVSNLLDVSQIVCGRVTVEPKELDLVALVRDVVDRSQIELERAHCELHLTTDVPVVGQWDGLRIERVVSNLLSNAMKYGAGKPIEITVDTEDGDARLIVRDHGIGIARDQIDRIFGRFERAVSAHRYGGLGLGLYIVRQFVEAHGGSVQVDAVEGEGSTFIVRLPFEQEESCAD